MSSENMCCLDKGPTHTILTEKKYFSSLIMRKSYVNTTSGSAKLIERSGRDSLLLRGRTLLEIKNALYYSKSKRNLLSFKVICKNGYHVETANEGMVAYLYITMISEEKNIVHKKLPTLSSGLYHTNIGSVESYVVVNKM